MFMTPQTPVTPPVPVTDVAEVVKSTWDSFHMTSDRFIALSLFVLGGFVLGFLVKHFGKIVVIAVVGSIFVLGIFDYLKLVTINYKLMYEILGVKSFSDLGVQFITWGRVHVMEMCALVVGMFISWKYS